MSVGPAMPLETFVFNLHNAVTVARFTDPGGVGRNMLIS
jgi:hypothetical protein